MTTFVLIAVAIGLVTTVVGYKIGFRNGLRGTMQQVMTVADPVTKLLFEHMLLTGVLESLDSTDMSDDHDIIVPQADFHGTPSELVRRQSELHRWLMQAFELHKPR